MNDQEITYSELEKIYIAGFLEALKQCRAVLRSSNKEKFLEFLTQEIQRMEEEE